MNHASPTPVRTSSEQERRERARLRAVAVRRRLVLATDALAAADLLLGVNFSIGSVGQEKPK